MSPAASAKGTYQEFSLVVSTTLLKLSLTQFIAQAQREGNKQVIYISKGKWSINPLFDALQLQANDQLIQAAELAEVVEKTTRLQACNAMQHTI